MKRSKTDKFKANASFITIDEWRRVHPTAMKSSTDNYYAKVATRIYKLLKSQRFDAQEIQDDDLRRIAVDMAAYLEDKISGLNIWNSFIGLYRKMGLCDYPLYDISSEEMYDDEPNFSDVRFLLWYQMTNIIERIVVNPFNLSLESTAKDIFNILEEEFERAPETEILKEWLLHTDTYDDPTDLFKVMYWAASLSYLFRSRHRAENVDSIIAITKDFYGYAEDEDTDDGYEDGMLMIAVYFLAMNTTTGPLDVHPWVYLAQILDLQDCEQCHEYAERLRAMKSRTILPYLIKDRDEMYLSVEDIDGNRMNICLDNVEDVEDEMMQPGKTLLAPLYYYEDSWHVNGWSDIIPEDEGLEVFDDTRRDFEIASAADKRHYNESLQANHGSPIGIVRNAEALDKILGFSKSNDSDYRAVLKEIKDYKDILFFVNRNSDPVIFHNMAKAIKLPGNTLYNPEYATENACKIIFSGETTKEMRDYVLEHNLIPDARMKGEMSDEKAKAWFAKNAPFLSLALHTDNVHFNMTDILSVLN